MAPVVRSGLLADALRTGQCFLQSDTGQIIQGIAITAGLAIATGGTSLAGAGVGALFAGGVDLASQWLRGGPFDTSQFLVSVSRGAAIGRIGGWISSKFAGGGGILRAATSEFAGGRLHTLATNALTGEDLGKDLFNPTDMIIDVGGGMLGAATGQWVEARSQKTMNREAHSP